MANAILWYEIKNYGSFGGEGGLVDLTTTEKDRHKELWRNICGHQVNLITAIMGANGSGKTTLLKPLSFLSDFFWAIPAKVSEQIGIVTSKPFKDLTSLKICFILKDKIYTYELGACEVFIASEALYYKNENNKNVYIFKRKLNKNKLSDYAKQIDGAKNFRELSEVLKTFEYEYTEKNDLFSFGANEARRTPVNTSIISAARRVGVGLAEDISYYLMPLTNVNTLGRQFYGIKEVSRFAEFLYDKEELFGRVKDIIKKWDFGLKDIKIEKEVRTNQDGEEINKYLVRGVHQLESGEEFELPFQMESAGTQSAFVRLFLILNSLETGSPCVIDELGDDLHPHMVKPILELFINPETNPFDAQIIFTCHKPELINYLGKYRVVIAEKKFNRSECFRLDDFPSSEARTDENLAAKYLAGSFGGVPEI